MQELICQPWICQVFPVTWQCSTSATNCQSCYLIRTHPQLFGKNYIPEYVIFLLVEQIPTGVRQASLSVGITILRYKIEKGLRAVQLEYYRVIKSNCNKWFFSGEPKNSKKWPNPIFFWKLICGGFGILMSQNGQVKKSCAFSGCAKMVFWLHTTRTENPDTP